MFRYFRNIATAASGLPCGVLIKELGLLARAVFMVYENSIVKYKQIVDELTNEPDYELALKAVKELLC